MSHSCHTRRSADLVAVSDAMGRVEVPGRAHFLHRGRLADNAKRQRLTRLPDGDTLISDAGRKDANTARAFAFTDNAACNRIGESRQAAEPRCFPDWAVGCPADRKSVV